MSKALLLIDIQNDYFEGGLSELVDPLQAADNAKKILTIFRENKLPIIHVQHINTREGATFFLPNTDGVKIHAAVQPLENEYVITKHTPNSFFETRLSSILNENNINSLVVCGMMSHMCIDTTVRAAKDYAIDITLVEDACATKDLSFQGVTISARTVHCAFMAGLSGMFAKVIGASELKILP